MTTEYSSFRTALSMVSDNCMYPLAPLYDENITNFVNDTITFARNNVVNKYLSARNSYNRLTFIQAHHCYVCEAYNTNIKCSYIDCNIGRAGLYGWLYCPACEHFVKADKERRELQLTCLPISSYNFLRETNVMFWRKSRSTTKPSYLETNANFNMDGCDTFSVPSKYKLLVVSIHWEDPRLGLLEKGLPLANLIFFNRNIFGYHQNHMIDTIIRTCKLSNNSKWRKFWIKHITEQYKHANGWLEFYTIAVRNKIPREVILNILDSWGMFYLGRHLLCKDPDDY